MVREEFYVMWTAREVFIVQNLLRVQNRYEFLVQRKKLLTLKPPKTDRDNFAKKMESFCSPLCLKIIFRSAGRKKKSENRFIMSTIKNERPQQQQHREFYSTCN